MSSAVIDSTVAKYAVWVIVTKLLPVSLQLGSEIVKAQVTCGQYARLSTPVLLEVQQRKRLGRSLIRARGVEQLGIVATIVPYRLSWEDLRKNVRRSACAHQSFASWELRVFPRGL
jgi:hypothetical protein